MVTEVLDNDIFLELIQDKSVHIIFYELKHQETDVYFFSKMKSGKLVTETVNITVITEEPEKNLYENIFVLYLMIDEMKNVGIHVKTIKNIMR